MKVGDLVKGAYDRGKYRTGIVLRIISMENSGWLGANRYREEHGTCIVEVLWNTAPMGLDQKGTAWIRQLEVISEAR